MVGVGFVEEVGLIGVMIWKLVKVVLKFSLIVVLVFFGVMLSIVFDVGYLVLILLGVVVFYKVGWYFLVGLFVVFVGVLGGFGVNLVIMLVDGMFIEILNDVVYIINLFYFVDLMVNFYFLIVLIILVVIVFIIINEKFIEFCLGIF